MTSRFIEPFQEEKTLKVRSQNSSLLACFYGLLTISVAAMAVFSALSYLEGVGVSCNIGKTTLFVDKTTQDSVKNEEVLKTKAKHFRYSSVATDEATCASIGNDVMLKKGGSAADAAVATLFCNGVINFPLSGIGGGFIMVLYERVKGI